jgi:hypothetical protein
MDDEFIVFYDDEIDLSGEENTCTFCGEEFPEIEELPSYLGTFHICYPCYRLRREEERAFGDPKPTTKMTWNEYLKLGGFSVRDESSGPSMGNILINKEEKNVCSVCKSKRTVDHLPSYGDHKRICWGCYYAYRYKRDHVDRTKSWDDYIALGDFEYKTGKEGKRFRTDNLKNRYVKKEEKIVEVTTAPYKGSSIIRFLYGDEE